MPVIVENLLEKSLIQNSTTNAKLTNIAWATAKKI